MNIADALLQVAVKSRMLATCLVHFFGGGRDLNPRPCIYYALSIPTERNSQGPHVSFMLVYVGDVT